MHLRRSSVRLWSALGLWAVLGIGAWAAPSITLPPQAATITAGSTAVFGVSAAGTAPFHYDWRRDGVSLGAPDLANYTTPPATLADSGAAFSVAVTDATGTKLTASAYLTVNPAAPRGFASWASAIADPAQRTATSTPLGDGVPNLVKYTLGLGANQRPTTGDLPELGANAGGQVFRYERDRAATGVTIGPEKSTTLAAGSWTAVPATKVADSGISETWEANVATGDARTFYRLSMAINSDTAPSITTQPSGSAVNLGSAATFTVAAEGTGPFTYQWRRNGIAVAGGAGASYSTPVATGADHGARFSVLVTGPAGTVASADAALAVSAGASLLPPVIITQPAAASVTAGQPATFSVAAAGTASLHYQWRKNGVAVGGAAAATYITPLTTLADTGTIYSVVVTNDLGGEISWPAVLTVTTPPPPVINSFGASPMTITAGQASTLSWSVVGATSLSINQGVGAVSGTSRSVSPTATTTYTLTATNAAGAVTSTATVIVTGGAVPVLGAHRLVTEDQYLGHSPVTTAPVTTQATGSVLLAVSLQDNVNSESPTDNYSNIWAALGPKHNYTGGSAPWYHAMWAATGAHGGSGHRLSVAKPGFPGSEASLEFIEIRNATQIKQHIYAWTEDTASPTTPSITTDGPAVLIAVWTGGSWDLNHTAVPDNGFTVIDSYLLLGPQSGIQVAIAMKQVSQAGTYSTTWAVTPTQGSGCFLIAVQ